MTNCPNCGAPVDLTRLSCEYCDTPYALTGDFAVARLFADGKVAEEIRYAPPQIAVMQKFYAEGIISLNEFRDYVERNFLSDHRIP